MTNTKLLDAAIRNSGKSKQFLAKKANLSRYGLYNKIIGKNEFLASEITILCAELNLTSKERDAIFFSAEVNDNHY